jgi:hypothetical protein
MALVPSRPNRREMPGGMWAVARCGTGPCPRGYCFGWRCLGSLLARCSARNPPGGGGARLALLVVLPGGCPGSVPWTGVAGSRREQAQSLAAPSGVCPLLRVAALLCCVYCRRVGAQGGGRGVRMEPRTLLWPSARALVPPASLARLATWLCSNLSEQACGLS